MCVFSLGRFVGVTFKTFQARKIIRLSCASNHIHTFWGRVFNIAPRSFVFFLYYYFFFRLSFSWNEKMCTRKKNTNTLTDIHISESRMNVYTTELPSNDQNDIHIWIRNFYNNFSFVLFSSIFCFISSFSLAVNIGFTIEISWN